MNFRFYRTYLAAAFFSVAIALMFTSPSYAQLFSNGQGVIEAGGENKEEYYYWDGDKIIGTAGQHQTDTEYNGSGNVLSLSSDPFDPKDVEDSCQTLPNNEANLEIRIQGDGSAIVDVTGDGSGGATQGSGEMKTTYTVTNGSTNSPSGRPDVDYIDCSYRFYEHFNYQIVAYGANRLTGNSVSGKLLGQQGMPFDEWVERSDRRNIYDAYLKSAEKNTFEHCDTVEPQQKDACTVAILEAFNTCYAEGLGLAQTNLDSSVLKSPAWTKDLNTTKFVDCMKAQDTLDQFFPSKSAIGDFAQEILDEADIPPSVKPKAPSPEDDKLNANDDTRCSIAKIGWILCPTLQFISMINDQLFNIMKNWLELQPFQEKAGSQNSAAYEAWISMRNLANVVFIVLMLVAVMSQLTSFGTSVFNLRKLVPRLVVTAMLVNISFIVCAVAIDISNIAGDSIFRVLKDFDTPQAASSGLGNWEGVTSSVVLAGGALAGSLVILGNLAALVPIMLMALFAMVVTLLVLLLRQALIIVLVVIAPVAFALYLLPNTQQWFNKWKSTFVTLLMLYPAIAVVFGGSYLASQIIRETAEQNGQTLLAIFSLGVQVIPLFVTPLLMKLGGGVLNRFGGIVNNKNKGPYDRTMKAAQGWRQDRKVMQQTRAANRGIGGLENSKLMNKIDGDGKARSALKKANRFNPYAAAQRAKARNDARVTQHQDNLNRATTRLTDSDPDAVARAATGLGGSDLREAVKQQISQQADQLERAGASAASVLIGDKTEEEALQMVTSGKDAHGKDISSEMRTAAAQKVAGSRNVENINKMLEQLNRTSGQFSDSQRHAIIDTIESSGAGSLAPHLQSSNLGAVRDGSLQNVGELYGSAAQQGLYSPDAISGMHESGIDGLAAAHRNGYINGDQMQQVKRNYAFATRNDKFNQNLSNATKERMNML